MSRYEMALADEWERREEDEYEPDEVGEAEAAWERARDDGLLRDLE